MKKLLSLFLVAAPLFYWIGTMQAAAPLKPMKADGIEYLAGGIGVDERQEMEEMAKDFNVKAVFAGSSGLYLADIKVTIARHSGEKVLDTTSNGPWLFVKLPPGTYSITAVWKGMERKETVDAGQGLKSVLFAWKS